MTSIEPSGSCGSSSRQSDWKKSNVAPLGVVTRSVGAITRSNLTDSGRGFQEALACTFGVQPW